MPLLSILVPTYNRAGYLRDCLDSLLATTVDCEIIVADNASPDDTEALMATYTDPRIRYHRHATNIGSTANHNFLLAQIRGKYACLFGDDDMALSDCFEKKVALLEASPQVDLVYSLVAGMDAAGTPMPSGSVMGQAPCSYVGGRDEFAELLVNCYISWQSLVFRSALLAEIGDLAEGFGLKASADWYWLQKMVRGRQTAFLRERTVRLRYHPGSYSVSEVIKEGYWGSDRLIIYRRWLLEHPDPPYVSDPMWQRMGRCVTSDVQSAAGDDKARLEAALAQLEEIRQAYLHRMDDRAQAAIWTMDPYQPGTPPWPLEDLRARSFLLPPMWQGERWREVLRSYVETFGPADDVTLVMCADPAAGVTPEVAGERVLGVLAEAGVTEPPDLLLVPEPATEAAYARVYAAVDVVVAAGDRRIAHRARRLGKAVLDRLTPEAWRAPT